MAEAFFCNGYITDESVVGIYISDKLTVTVTGCNNSKILSFPRGNDNDILLTIDSTDITDAELTFTVKKKYSDTTALITKKNVNAGGTINQISFSDAPNGKAIIHLNPSDSSDLLGQYEYDIFMTLSGVSTTLIVSYIDFTRTVK